tara:strand:+ start:187 stop:345 length:159 start_codon:yes stop_codon:yes gene_type:complete
VFKRGPKRRQARGTREDVAPKPQANKTKTKTMKTTAKYAEYKMPRQLYYISS